jgi:hypothetical protein
MAISKFQTSLMNQWRTPFRYPAHPLGPELTLLSLQPRYITRIHHVSTWNCRSEHPIVFSSWGNPFVSRSPYILSRDSFNQGIPPHTPSHSIKPIRIIQQTEREPSGSRFRQGELVQMLQLDLHLSGSSTILHRMICNYVTIIRPCVSPFLTKIRP